ncbi:MAG TPA: SigE family RNA polymerase sigma factor [Marmoricola sp.]|nr:SigE family RNA polymerase sigma factor [Marmoricola sp.]
MSSPDDGFTEFVEHSWPGLYRTAYLLVGERDLAEDLVQTALAKTFVSWGRVRDRAAAGVYARTVLVNTASSWFRRRAWSREIASASLPDEPFQSEQDDRPTLVAALRTLPPRQRAVVVLRFFDDLSVQQTADALRISTGTVKSQTTHALNKLRVALGDAFVPVTDGARHD